MSAQKLSARNFWLVALAALIGVAHSPAARAADAVNVVTPSVVIFAIPYWIAEHQGYFKDEDIAPTLDIEPNGKRITERLLSGATQFSLVGPDAVLIDATQGGPLRILAGVVRKPPLFLIAKSSIKTFADLRGANIGALSLTEGSSKLLIKMAKAEGLAAADLKISAVGGAPARQTLLKDGKIDAGMQPLPLNLEAEALGFNNLGWAGKYEPDWQFTTVNANGDWARKNPRVATGFVRALLRGQQFIWSNPDQAARIAADVLKTDVALARRSLAEAIRLGILDPKLDWSELGLQRIYENMQADGAIPAERKFELGKVTDAEYLRAVQGSATAK
jgi:ABC-type nitrate/sulfonate/bicarbonate transport system substrate-binding protein